MKRWTKLGLLGLAIAGATSLSSSVQAQTTTNVVSYLTFESATYDPDTGAPLTPDGRPRGTWTYNYMWAPWTDNPNVNPMGNSWYPVDPNDPNVPPTNTCMQVNFDTTAYALIPSGNGFGLGFGATMPSFDNTVIRMSTNRANYRFSFDARAEGVIPGVNTVDFQMQVQMDAPDGTIQPPDSDGKADRIIQINKDLSVGTNWTHFEYWLDTANVDGGTPESNLTLYGGQVNSVNMNVNLNAPNTAFDFDWDNYFYVDNVKLEVSTYVPPPPPPVIPVTMAEWNFDDKPVWYSYGTGNWSQNSFLPTFTQNAAATGYGVGGSNAWILTMDNSALAAPNTPSWAGGNCGGGGPVDLTQFNTSDMTLYRISFDTRAEGLAPDKTSTTCRLQLFLDAPDQTIQPPDTDGKDDNLVRLDFDVPAKTNWQTVTYTLNKGVAGSGSKDNFTAYFNKVSAVRTQWQIENAASSDWGFDADNALVMDNFKMERLVPGLPAVTVSNANNNVVISWGSWTGSGTVQLQTTSNPGSPTSWTAVTGATTSPATVAKTSGAQFFRLLWVPPAQ